MYVMEKILHDTRSSIKFETSLKKLRDISCKHAFRSSYYLNSHVSTILLLSFLMYLNYITFLQTICLQQISCKSYVNF